jgi:hypothetical protein
MSSDASNSRRTAGDSDWRSLLELSEFRINVPESETFPIFPAGRHIAVVKEGDSEKQTSALCKCGYPDCAGHEVVDGEILFPGYTSEKALAFAYHNEKQLIRFGSELILVKR